MGDAVLQRIVCNFLLRWGPSGRQGEGDTASRPLRGRAGGGSALLGRHGSEVSGTPGGASALWQPAFARGVSTSAKASVDQTTGKQNWAQNYATKLVHDWGLENAAEGHKFFFHKLLGGPFWRQAGRGSVAYGCPCVPHDLGMLCRDGTRDGSESAAERAAF